MLSWPTHSSLYWDVAVYHMGAGFELKGSLPSVAEIEAELNGSEDTDAGRMKPRSPGVT